MAAVAALPLIPPQVSVYPPSSSSSVTKPLPLSYSLDSFIDNPDEPLYLGPDDIYNGTDYYDRTIIMALRKTKRRVPRTDEAAMQMCNARKVALAHYLNGCIRAVRAPCNRWCHAYCAWFRGRAEIRRFKGVPFTHVLVDRRRIVPQAEAQRHSTRLRESLERRLGVKLTPWKFGSANGEYYTLLVCPGVVIDPALIESLGWSLEWSAVDTPNPDPSYAQPEWSLDPAIIEIVLSDIFVVEKIPLQRLKKFDTSPKFFAQVEEVCEQQRMALMDDWDRRHYMDERDRRNEAAAVYKEECNEATLAVIAQESAVGLMSSGMEESAAWNEAWTIYDTIRDQGLDLTLDAQVKKALDLAEDRVGFLELGLIGRRSAGRDYRLDSERRARVESRPSMNLKDVAKWEWTEDFQGYVDKKLVDGYTYRRVNAYEHWLYPPDKTG